MSKSLRNALLASGAVLTLCATGCGIDPGVDPEIGPLTDEDAAAAPWRAARDGHVRGVIGDQAVNDPAQRVDVFDDGAYRSIGTVALVGDRAVMTQLMAGEGVPHLFTPGLEADFPLDEQSDVTLLGCVGQAVDVYDIYDAPADNVHVAVGDDDALDEVTVTVTGTWESEDKGTPPTVAVTSFVLTR
jgi:hypothetical protein